MRDQQYVTSKLLIEVYCIDPCYEIVENIQFLCSHIGDKYSRSHNPSYGLMENIEYLCSLITDKSSQCKLMLKFLLSYSQVREEISNILSYLIN